LKYVFPEYWDRRATTAIGAFHSSDHERTLKVLDRILRDGHSKFFSSTLYALSMLYAWDEDAMTEGFASLVREMPNALDVVKLSAFAASDLGREGFDADGRGDLDRFHKALAGVFFEAVLEMQSCRKLVLSNESSRLSVIADESKVFVSFEVDGEKDSGAATLATMTPSWFKRNDEDWDVRHVELVTDTKCAGTVAIENVTSEDNQELHRDLVAIYDGFRSRGVLKIEFDLEADSAWNLTVNMLRPLVDMAHIQVLDVNPK
jgi:hypothetical protein